MRPVALAIAALLLAAGQRADAGRRAFAYAWDTEVMPERGVELEWWYWESDGDGAPIGWVTVSTAVGLTDNLELAVPFEIVARSAAGVRLSSAGADLRWRLADADPARAGPLVPLVRIGARRLFDADAARFEGDLVLSIDLGARLHAVVDAGGYGITSSGRIAATFSGGLSYAVLEELRAGVEVTATVPLHGDYEYDGWLSAGPALSFTHGRFWLTASVPIGLTAGAPRLTPRVIWATAF